VDDKTLSALGMSAGERKIYRALFKMREASPAQLAKTSGIRRTTAYSIVQGLAQKGFLVENPSKRPRTYTIAQSADIDTVLKEGRKRLELREKVLTQFAAELSRAAAEDSYPVPLIRFVGEDKMQEYLNKEPWTATSHKTDSTWWGFQDHTYVEEFLPVIERFWRKHPKKIHLKLLSNRGAEDIEKKLKWRYPNRQIKVWNRATNFVSSTWVVGDYVVIVNTRRRPFYFFEIHDEVLAHDLREVFKNLWLLV
jgi:DNA-binding MarR family transcriptional regulator